MNTVLRRDFALNFVFAATGFFFSVPTGSFADCLSPANAIEAENCLPGNPASEWDIDGAGDASIQGFATDISVNRGQTVQFKVKAPTPAATPSTSTAWATTAGTARAWWPPSPLRRRFPRRQPACLTNATGLVDCGNWAVSASWAVPASATSGIYFARLVRTERRLQPHRVRGAQRQRQLRPSCSRPPTPPGRPTTATAARACTRGRAPEAEGARTRSATTGRSRRATTRPRTGCSTPSTRWSAGWSGTGTTSATSTGVDSDRRGAGDRRAQGLPVGRTRRVLVEAAAAERREGARPAVPGADGARPPRVPERERGLLEDALGVEHRRGRPRPIGRSSATRRRTTTRRSTPRRSGPGTWRDPRFSPPADGGRPENELTGTIFTVNGTRFDAIEVPAADAQMRFWRNTPNVVHAHGSQVSTRPDGTLGYEWDEDLDNGVRPAGLVRLSRDDAQRARAHPARQRLDLRSRRRPPITSSFHKRPSGALVFGAGTVQWSWGLDSEHDRGNEPASVDMQQATVNLLADMGAQPATLQASLIPASRLDRRLAAGVGDHRLRSTARPSRWGRPPSRARRSTTEARWRRRGLGGRRRDLASAPPGRESWSFSWTFVSGHATTSARARSTTAATSKRPLAGITVTVGNPPPPSGSVSIWSGGGNPTPPEPERRAADRSSACASVRPWPGYITALRFFKGSQDTGTHVGTPVDARRAHCCASAPFTGETASGWQEVTLATPVAITANTTYVVSYHSSAGYYVATDGYFTQAFSNHPLTALADGTDGANGLYQYGATGFPTQTFGSANYWVDVVFTVQPPGPDTTPPTVTGTAPASGATSVPAAANVSASFSEPLNPATVNGSTVQLRNAAAQLVAARRHLGCRDDFRGARPDREPRVRRDLHRHRQGRLRRREGPRGQRARGRRRLVVHRSGGAAVGTREHLGRRRQPGSCQPE